MSFVYENYLSVKQVSTAEDNVSFYLHLEVWCVREKAVESSLSYEPLDQEESCAECRKDFSNFAASCHALSTRERNQRNPTFDRAEQRIFLDQREETMKNHFFYKLKTSLPDNVGLDTNSLRSGLRGMSLTQSTTWLFDLLTSVQRRSNSTLA